MAIPEVWTISITGTWVEDDTCYLELNGKQLVLTVGTAVTIADIGAALVAMINGNAAVGTESRSALGSSVGEFARVTASYVAADANLVITGQSDGRPIGTLSVDSTGSAAGTIAIDGGTFSTAGTGPNDWDNADNWSADTAPVNTDSVVCDHQASSAIKYNLDQTSLTLASLIITNGFRHSIGLSEINRDSANVPYDENLTTFLSLAAATVMNIDGSGGGSIKIDCAATDSTTTVTGSGSSVDANMPAIQLNLNNAGADLNVLGGDVGVCLTSGTAGNLATLTCGGSQQSRLTIGDTVTLAAGTVSAGKVIINGSITTLTVEGGECEQRGAGTIGTLNLNRGTFTDISIGTITALYQNGGVYDRSKDNRGKTISAYVVYARSTIKDPFGTITASAGFDFYPRLQDLTIDFPTRKKYTLAAVS